MLPEQKNAILVQIASIREVVLGAPLKVLLKNLSMKTVGPEAGQPVALVHRPNESFFVIPQVIDHVLVLILLSP
jgi:actin related protein 2/3 complex, subunit 2